MEMSFSILIDFSKDVIVVIVIVIVVVVVVAVVVVVVVVVVARPRKDSPFWIFDISLNFSWNPLKV